MLGRARENIILAYKRYLRELEVLRVSVQNRQAVIAAGIYEKPFDSLNEATDNYFNKLDYAMDQVVITRQQTNQDLYEEWKQLFGKIDEQSA